MLDTHWWSLSPFPSLSLPPSSAFSLSFLDKFSLWGQANLQLAILLPPPPECLNYRCALYTRCESSPQGSMEAVPILFLPFCCVNSVCSMNSIFKSYLHITHWFLLISPSEGWSSLQRVYWPHNQSVIDFQLTLEWSSDLSTVYWQASLHINVYTYCWWIRVPGRRQERWRDPQSPSRNSRYGCAARWIFNLWEKQSSFSSKKLPTVFPDLKCYG